ncbi:nucleoside monophosphate kinase [Candidatus Daviesbacteria bacterium]|nr:nucleoside monophosphate kinase [Candidatus Daviesbacteria bacterium]
MKILIAGPQGSGKTTQAQLLADHFNLCFQNMGNLVRVLSKENSDLGRGTKAALDKGQLVDDVVVANLVKNWINLKDCPNGFVFDGYPRTMSQLKLFDPNYDRVVYLDVSDEEVTRRLLKRGREDDTLEIIKTRLSIYHRQTEEVLNFYREQSKLIQTSGMGSVEEINRNIESQLQ